MIIVVSNTSPLIALSAIGRFNLLHERYDQIWIPDAVRHGFVRISAALYRRALEEAGEV